MHGVRTAEHEMSREILTELEDAGIGMASATYEITGTRRVLLPVMYSV